MKITCDGIKYEAEAAGFRSLNLFDTNGKLIALISLEAETEDALLIFVDSEGNETDQSNTELFYEHFPKLVDNRFTEEQVLELGRYLAAIHPDVH